MCNNRGIYGFWAHRGLITLAPRDSSFLEHPQLLITHFRSAPHFSRVLLRAVVASFRAAALAVTV